MTTIAALGLVCTQILLTTDGKVDKRPGAYRCENKEVVCYVLGSSNGWGGDYAMSCIPTMYQNLFPMVKP